MPTTPDAVVESQSERLTPLERALISAINAHNMRLTAAVEAQTVAMTEANVRQTAALDKISANVPGLRFVQGTAVVMSLGMLALVTFVVAGLLQLNGVDTETAAAAARTAVPVTSPATPPPVAAPPGSEE